MKERFVVHSPWAEVDTSGSCALNPRLETLNGKTIGMFASFKGHYITILEELEKEIIKYYPEIKFSHIVYKRDTIEIVDDPDFLQEFKEWVDGVDAVISSNGDDGSSTLYNALNTVLVEKLGKPAVMLARDEVKSSGILGAHARHVPMLRIETCNVNDLTQLPKIDKEAVETYIIPEIVRITPKVIDALIRPLTAEETKIHVSDVNKYSADFTGTREEITEEFYRLGFTNGIPIELPTEEAVSEMLRGTDMPRDYVVAELPPRLGKATVEKIAINAVMAGCLPTHLPVLIAAVKGMVDPRVHIVGWTCSVASFAPMLVVHGPIRKDIAITCGKNYLSPYWRANACIAKAFSLLLSNICGVRPTMENNSYMGHEGRFCTCFGEDEENSPWAPFHTDYGMEASDSAVTMFWYMHRDGVGGTTADKLLTSMCSQGYFGFDPGCNIVLAPAAAKILADEGFTREDVRKYIAEYARKPATDIKVRWMKDNNHMPKSIPLPMDKTASTRKYWSTEHIAVFVAGSDKTPRNVAYNGGGDHGGPICTKIELPEAWEELCRDYPASFPEYICY